MAETEIPVEDLSVPEQEAFGLSRAAILLDQARQNLDNKEALGEALTHNLELWVAIRAMVDRDDSPLPKEVRENLVRLSNFVADTTFKTGEGISEKSIDTLININLQIADFLLRSC